ncbi:hypothetical protein [Bdellovibrio svalbardensis]|uniref:Outer membrane protein beta-barrel domain-containing protein n=1 Tax=Bdellovibrio svalbardensis TaxID=2972972 RepID=A0ABT6DDD9_9BACT|nr:hypothetical protein [Bdellovibrio svalbardensis]MDG0814838.1 hypothetical protein [Bdellovibrio svalbardensis]
MKSSVSILFSVVTLLSGTYALAQSSLEGFSTGRYEIHKSSKSAKSSRKPSSVEGEESKPVTDADGMKVRLLTPSELAAEKAAEAKVAAEIQAKKLAEQKTAEKKVVEDKAVADKKIIEDQKASEVTVAAADVEEPSISEQAESLFSSQSEKVYDYYRQEIHPDDIRNNKVEVEFSPLLGYNDSSSNYSFRKYQNFFEALKLKANVWLTPLIGVSGQILFSFGGDIDDANHSKVSAKYENLDLGFNFRKFFGVSRKSNSLEFSVLYSDNNFKVSKDSTMHPRIKSSGVGVGLKGRFPTSMSYAWTVGGTFFPRLQHSESATAVNVSSGSTDENTRIGFDVGGEWKFSRHSQMIWSLGVTSEKNLFTGSATLPDSSTGLIPSGVSVTNTMYLMNLGYRWGH